MNVINWLRSPTATLLVLCSALASQVPHAADVFRLIVAGDGWPAVIHSYAYAVALELAVLLFVVQRRNTESYLFAAVSILVNLSYYSLHGVNLFALSSAPAWLVSIALPSAIARYSHLLVDDSGQEDHQNTHQGAGSDSTNAPVQSQPTTEANIHSDPENEPAGDSTPKQPQLRVITDYAAEQRRRQVHELKAQGQSNIQIAQALGIHRNTVASDLRTNGFNANGKEHA